MTLEQRIAELEKKVAVLEGKAQEQQISVEDLILYMMYEMETNSVLPSDKITKDRLSRIEKYATINL